MITDLKPYAEYKESGLPWLGQVPGHWEVRPGFAAFREKHIKNIGMREKTVLSLSYGHIVVKPPERLHGLVPDSFETYQIVDPGDIVIRSTDLQNDWNSLRVGLVRNRGIITSAYLCFKTTDAIFPEYGHQLLHAFDLLKVFYGLGSGLRQNLDWGDFKRMLILLPPPAEQAAIVRFLDWANGRLERAIRAKRKVIALLNEQKQAIISSLVTGKCEVRRVKGEDGCEVSVLTPRPSHLMKPSGVPWLGEIPKHWEVRRAKTLFRQVVTPVPDNAEQVTCFRNGQVTLRRNRRITGFTNAIFELGYQGILPGQLCLHSMDAFAGAIGVSDSAGKCSPEYVICEPALAGVEPSYFARLLRVLALQGMFIALCPSVRERAPRVRYSDFGMFALPRPPLEEQQQVLNFLDKVEAELAPTLERLARELEFLREYRTRLVADVVTGKLDVRSVKCEGGSVKEEDDELDGDVEEGQGGGEGDYE